MRLIDLLTFFPTSTEFESKTGLSAPNYNNWKRFGYIPIKAQLKIESVTGGQLQASGDDMMMDLREFKAKQKMLDVNFSNFSDPFMMRDKYFTQLQEAKQTIMLLTRQINDLQKDLMKFEKTT